MLALLLALHCGTELWAQKVLTDPGAARALAPAPVTSTIADLTALHRTARRRAYIVDGLVTVIKHEADQDFHIVISDDSDRTMIVEAPLPACAQGSLAYAAIVRARRQAAALRVGQKIRVVGMFLVDKIHGQTGVAPNGAELHPIFSLTVLP